MNPWRTSAAHGAQHQWQRQGPAMMATVVAMDVVLEHGSMAKAEVCVSASTASEGRSGEP
jgi:hypothetical protein